MRFVLNEQQQRSVQQMVDREHSGRIQLQTGSTLFTRLGINGNAAGSGKTRAMLSLIHQDIECPHMTTLPLQEMLERGLLSYELRAVETTTTHKVTIILANSSIRHQWINELHTASCLRYVLLDNVRKLTTFVPSEVDVAVVSMTVYKRLVSMGHLWHRFIYDETDSYVFSGMLVLSASFTWFVTATWQLLERMSVSRAHALRHILRGAPISELVVQSPSYDQLPTIEEHLHLFCPGVSITTAIAGYVDAEVMVQIEVGNISGAIQLLGGNSSTSNIVDLVRGRLESRLHDARLRSQLRTGNTLHWTERIAQLQRDISRVNERFQSILTDETCSVCMGHFENPVLTPCHHVFCLRCIVPWLGQQETCPQCRSPLHPTQLTTLASEEQKHLSVIARSTIPTKIECLEQILGVSPGQRTLIFAEHDHALSTIYTVLAHHSCATLSGHPSTREATLKRYKSGEIPILLLNSRSNGAGIDLPETTDIVLFHHLGHGREDQAIGRGQRLGRTVPLRIHRFRATPVL